MTTTAQAPKRHQKYECTGCGREVGKDKLRAKQVRFKLIGKGGADVRSRIVGWLCTIPQDDGSPSCLERDEDWTRPMYAASPGMADTDIAREAGYGAEV